MTHGLWLGHLHKRKRIYRRFEPYPHPNKWIRWLDYTVLVVGILGPMANIPQIMKIYLEHHTSGLSILTWSLFTVFTIPWLIYGIIHKAKPIIIANTLWFTTQLIVVIGIVMFS